MIYLKKSSKVFLVGISTLIFFSSLAVLCKRSIDVSDKNYLMTSDMKEDNRKKYIVPNLVGEKYDDVSSSKIVKVEEEYNDEFQEGYIISQSIAPGTIKYTDDLITVKVSKGAETEYLPDIAGRSIGEASEELSSLGFVPTSKFVDVGDTEEQGIVLGYSNGAESGAPAARGSTICFDVAN